MPEKNENRPKRLTAQRKFNLYLETRDPDAPVGEILRRFGIHLSDLRKIEETIERSAISGLKANASRQAKSQFDDPEEIERIVQENKDLVKALASLTIENQLVKKKQRLDYLKGKKGKKSKMP